MYFWKPSILDMLSQDYVIFPIGNTRKKPEFELYVNKNSKRVIKIRIFSVVFVGKKSYELSKDVQTLP